MSNSPEGSGNDQRFQQTVPSISLPKGGGAIKGIGEKFASNPVTGTGSISVPIATSPGRSGFGPQLSLSYDSGSGNGPFGFGWGLNIPAITRKTDKGLPLYRDVEESDIYILSGTEDLVPLLINVAGQWQRHEETRTIGNLTFQIHRYRPRIEGLFARIERWTNLQTSEIHWRSISRENITTLYGKTGESRIADPADPSHIFSWLICQSYDDKGNAIIYEYVEENSDNIDLTQVHEKNRSPQSRSPNRYLKRIKYGNRTPNRDISWNATDPTQLSDWMFELVFDYDEGHFEIVSPPGSDPTFARASLDPADDWSVRQDPFSTYRAGFEVRTYRLCNRVLMFHHFPVELGVQDYLVRSTNFTYNQGQIASFLNSVSQSGYVRQNDGTYLSKSLPPVEFDYSQAIISNEVKEMDKESLKNLPYGLGGAQYTWVDLDGEGIAGLLTDQANAWYYKPNLGEGRFGPIELVAQKPSLAVLNGGNQQLIDLAGDGQLDLVLLDSSKPGFYERTQNESWITFRTFDSLPNVDWGDPNLRFLDLTGDGHADILITEEDIFHWHLSLAESGFSPRKSTRQMQDEERGPRLVFADGTQTIFLADLSGDGLTDLARIRNGEICYWPNLGYGHFGAKVTMDNSPRFDSPDLFEPQRIRLADIDGSGATDIIYLGQTTVDIYRNQSGNSWAEKHRLTNFPYINDLTSVTVADLFGNGTACLVWSSSLPGDSRQTVRYLDLMGGQKPHLLVASKNNLGAETRVQYAPSTKFYLQDKLNGKPWITRLPFPVHVVEKVETYDHISRNRFVTRYTYHHGFYDGIEREFRGFGYVEQVDTEEFAVLSASDQFPNGDNIDEASHVPPVLTKTWFHTGAYFEEGLISRQFELEYYREPGLSDDAFMTQLLPDTSLPLGLTLEETREAVRALKGSMLHQEVYALDGTPQASHPYTVSEHSQKLRLIQPRVDNQYAVFYVCACNVLDYHHERIPDDPRLTHQVSLEVDDFGNVLRAAAIAYGRRLPDPTLAPADQAKQTQQLITCVENTYTNAVDLPDDYRTPLPSESRSFELTGIPLASGFHYDFATIDNAERTALEIPYEDQPDGSLQKRLIEHVRTLCRRDDLTGPLPPGQLESLALPFESYQLAFTPELVTQIYENRVDDSMLLNEGRYVHNQGDSNWWMPSGQVFFSPNPPDSAAQELAFARGHFFLLHRIHDPFGNTSFIRYDDHQLLLLETEDALQNKVTVGERDVQGNITNRNNYRLLQPELVTDPNRNRVQVALDALGLVVGSAVMGKSEDTEGDSLAGFHPDLTRAEIDAFFADPAGSIASQILGSASTRSIYDETRFLRLGQAAPMFAATLARETHLSESLPAGGSKIQVSFSFSDGFGRAIQQKIQAEPGPLGTSSTITNPRWVGSGWTIFNNKGKPVKQFEPFFSNTHDFEFAHLEGVSSTLFYDPVERVVATLHPDHTWAKVVFDPWRQESWDANDTVLEANPGADPDVGNFFERLLDSEYLPTWHAQRIGGALGAAEQTAASKAADHTGTPAITHFDVLGRPFLSIADNASRGKLETRVGLDIEGNQRAVIDAKGRIVMRYAYDMLGNRVRQDSMEAGTRWGLPNVIGNPAYRWDSRNHRIQTTYDALQRPTDRFLQVAGGADLLVERTLYGETQGEANNHRGQIFQQFDGAGVVTLETYDFKGNILRSTRQFAVEYKNTLDWSTNPTLEQERFATSTAYDALNRPVSLVSPDDSQIRPVYNEANLLESLGVNLRGAADATPFVGNIDYNGKGQRIHIAYGNGVTTTYEYDPLTFRLRRLQSRRSSQALQDLSYTYDPVGNITAIQDGAQQTIFFNNAVVEPQSDYTYDAIYQLIAASGREHIGQVSAPQTTWDDGPRIHLPHPGDGQAMRRYTELYEYDEVGNFLRLVHQANNGNWQRIYIYEEPSLLEPQRQNNRLTRTEVGNDQEPYAHDAHGNITRMPHLALMDWDYKDQFQRVDLGGGGTAYYIYDAAGQRVRKVIERQNNTRQKERLYLGSFEVFREFDGSGNNIALERETLHVMDDEQRIALVETKVIENSLPTSTNPSNRLVRFQLNNHLSSACLELDHLAQIISYEEYYPYGSTAYQSARSKSETSKRYRYTSKERDEESGLYYHGARYYAPWLGRWTSCDPAGIADGLLLYRIARNHPIRFVDPNGRDPKDALESKVHGSQNLTSEDFCQGQCVSDRNIYEDVDIIISRWKRINSKSLKERIREAEDIAFRETSKTSAFWTYGDFFEYEKEEAYKIRGQELEEEFKKIRIRGEIDYSNRLRAEFENARDTRWAIQSFLVGAGALGKTVQGIAATYGSYEIGVGFVEGVTGESSGAHIENLASGKINGGRKLSIGERIFGVGNALLFVFSVGSTVFSGRTTGAKLRNGVRTFTSNDPLVADLANKIEAAYPGHVVGVNVTIRNSAGKIVTDADILLKNAVIQVKSGGGKGLASQIVRTESATGLPTIGYGPTLKTSVYKAIQRTGGLVTKDEGLLIQVVRP